MNQPVTQRMTLAADRAAPRHPTSRLVLISALLSRGEGGHSPHVQTLPAEEGSCPQSLRRSAGLGWWQEGSSQAFTSTILGRSCSRECCWELLTAPSFTVMLQLCSLLLSGEKMVILARRSGSCKIWCEIILVLSPSPLLPPRVEIGISDVFDSVGCLGATVQHCV